MPHTLMVQLGNNLRISFLTTRQHGFYYTNLKLWPPCCSSQHTCRHMVTWTTTALEHVYGVGVTFGPYPLGASWSPRSFEHLCIELHGPIGEMSMSESCGWCPFTFYIYETIPIHRAKISAQSCELKVKKRRALLIAWK